MSPTARFSVTAAVVAALLLPAASPVFAAEPAPMKPAAATPTPTPTPTPTATPSPTPTPTPTPTPATTWVTPIRAKYTISSYYGPRCMPLTGAQTVHTGLDLAAPSGTAIYAVADGIVTNGRDGTSSVEGYLSVQHLVKGKIYYSMYFHLWDADAIVKVGQRVKAGQKIATVGSSGGVTGPHLHLVISEGTSNRIDPYPFLKARGVDLYKAAAAITATKAPATCTYYTTGSVNLRTGASTSTPIVKVLPKGTAVVHVPGREQNSFLPVTVAGRSGWVANWLVSPTKPAPDPVPKPAAAPATPTYKTTAALNLRSSPSTSAKVLRVIPKAASVGKVLAKKGVWRKVTYKSTTGWVHSGYLKKK